MIVDVLGWVAVADAVAAVVLASLVYAIGQRSNPRVTFGRAVWVAVLFALPAASLYVAAWLIAGLVESPPSDAGLPPSPHAWQMAALAGKHVGCGLAVKNYVVDRGSAMRGSLDGRRQPRTGTPRRR
jgi:hypothetical protein